MRIVGNYFEDYFHRNSLKKTAKILKIYEPPRMKLYENDCGKGLSSIFLPNGYYKEKNFFLNEDFNDFDLFREFDD
jgi:hypothetical protein